MRPSTPTAILVIVVVFEVRGAGHVSVAATSIVEDELGGGGRARVNGGWPGDALFISRISRMNRPMLYLYLERTNRADLAATLLGYCSILVIYHPV